LPIAIEIPAQYWTAQSHIDFPCFQGDSNLASFDTPLALGVNDMFDSDGSF
jgi:hypothetical protein